KRVVDSVFVPDAASGSVAEPTDSQLRSQYETDKKTHTAPEYRAVSYVRLDADELAKEIAVSEDDLRAAYDQRIDEFSTPEKRNVRQMLISDEAKAKSAHQRVAEGADFLVVAKEVAGQDASAVELGDVTRDDLLPELADAVFALSAGQTSTPVKSALGWHIIQVTTVSGGGTMSFEEAKPKLQKEMAREKAIDGLYELSNTFEDALGGGATLDEAARQLNLKLLKIAAIDQQGNDRTGKAVENVPAPQAFVATTFATEENAESALTEAGEAGFFIVRVDKVTAPALRPFDEVKSKVSDAWKAEQRRAQAEARAKAILDAVNGGKPLAEAIGVQPLEVMPSKPLSRDGRGGGADFNAELIAQVFELKSAQAATKATMGRVGEGYRIAVLKTVTEANPAADTKGVEELAGVLGRSLQGDIAGQLQVAFREDVGVKVYQQA
ncbi:MAG: hypothetical protein HN333_15560, partial [Rhodospirillaceae bacterium]|nr:hypothetical protein [Rhodospirillaceae bacterium]